MLQQVTKDLLWKRGRAPRACSWRWWGTGQRPGWWWSRACPRHSRREKKGPAECGECFWPLRAGCWREFGVPTARSSPSPPAITEVPQGSPRSPDSGLCKCCSLCLGCGPPNLGQDALIPSSCYWGDLDSNRDSPGRTQGTCGRGSGYVITERENPGHWWQESSSGSREDYLQFSYGLAEM